MAPRVAQYILSVSRELGIVLGTLIRTNSCSYRDYNIVWGMENTQDNKLNKLPMNKIE